MPSFDGKQGSIDPRLAPALYSSSLVKSDHTMFSGLMPERGEIACKHRRLRVHVQHSRHADAHLVARFFIASTRFFWPDVICELRQRIGHVGPSGTRNTARAATSTNSDSQPSGDRVQPLISRMS